MCGHLHSAEGALYLSQESEALMTRSVDESIRLITDTFVPRISNQAAEDRARLFSLEGIIAHPTLSDVPFDAGGCWAVPMPRTHGRYLHGFLFLADWNGTILEHVEDRENAHRAALDLLLSWYANNKTAPGSCEMSFHDETTAQRSLQIARLLDNYPGTLPQEALTDIGEMVRLHLSLLSSSSFYAGNNNHGMFQDIALLRLATSRMGQELTNVERRTELRMLASRRLEQYFTSCFTEDGVHVENSPGYHFMVSRYLRDLLPVVDLLNPSSSSELRNIYSRAERYATHIIMPDGYLPPLGDTKHERVRDISHRTTFGSDEFLYSVFQGRKGTPPGANSAIFPSAGYALHRSQWDDAKSDWLLFKAGYHSNYHHHADDLSLLVHSGGSMVLGESGPYGYDYSNPLTTYAFSQFAHNVITVDGLSQPRSQPTPGGIDFIDHAQDSSNVFDVEGVNRRSKNWSHHRRVTVRPEQSHDAPGTRISVHDVVLSLDEGVHNYALRWHVGPEVKPLLRGNALELFKGHTKVLEITWRAPQPITARLIRSQDAEKPKPFRFPRFGVAEEATVLELSGSGPRFDVATDIRTSDFLLKDWGVGQKDSPWFNYQAEMPVNYRIEKSTNASKLVVVFSAMAPTGSFTYNYKSALAGVNAHKLYVLDDFGDQGAYFYSDHRALSIYRSVLEAVTHVKEELGIEWQDVAFVGSSKGGTAALVFGSSVPVGRIVVGAPQVKIGSFLRKPHPNILEYMTGGTTEECVDWADRIVTNHLRRVWSETKIDLLIGTRDHHYRDHLPTLRKELERMNHPRFSVQEIEGLTHADIGRPFRSFIGEQLEPWAGRQSFHSRETSTGPAVEAEVRGNAITATLTKVAQGSDIAFYLYEARDPVQKIGYVKNRFTMTFEDLPAGKYRVRCFVRSDTHSDPVTVSTPVLKVN